MFEIPFLNERLDTLEEPVHEHDDAIQQYRARPSNAELA
jgi:hypothetical protein